MCCYTKTLKINTHPFHIRKHKPSQLCFMMEEWLFTKKGRLEKYTAMWYCWKYLFTFISLERRLKEKENNKKIK